jgi:predicted XRE-type DNA-binding protein
MMVEITKGSDNVFEDLGFEGEEAIALKIKADLMIVLEKAIKKANLSQVKAAEILGIARPRLNQMMKGRLQGVTIDKMVEMVGRTGRTVDVKVTAARVGRDKLDARKHKRPRTKQRKTAARRRSKVA